MKRSNTVLPRKTEVLYNSTIHYSLVYNILQIQEKWDIHVDDFDK